MRTRKPEKMPVGDTIERYWRFVEPGPTARWFDWRNQAVCPTGATTVVLAYRTIVGREGVIRLYGSGYVLGSPAAPNWDWWLYINETRQPFNEPITATPFTIVANSPMDRDLSPVSLPFENESNVEVRVVNNSGVDVNVWTRIVGWYV